MGSHLKLAWSMAALLCVAGPASAADLAPVEVPTESGWTFTVAPYLWATGLKGDVGVDDLPEVDVDLSFSDIMKHFDIGVMAAGEARNGRFGILTDLLYVKLSAHDNVNAHIINADIDLTVKELTALGAGEYRVLEGDRGSVDLLAGGRLWSVKGDLDFDGAILDRSADMTETWVDPIVGLKARFNLSPEIYFAGWAMVGGFGISSKSFWDAMGGLGYQVSDSFSLFAGYRGLSINHKNDGFVFDVDMNGPLLGATFTF